jgi:hypothetical protein
MALYKTEERSEKYRQWLQETIESLDHSDKTAKETLPKMYYDLKERGIERLTARSMMEDDFGERWSRWSLLRFLPNEAKDQVKSAAGKASAESRKERRHDQESRLVTYPHQIVLAEKDVDEIVGLSRKFRSMEIVEVAPGEVRIRGL